MSAFRSGRFVSAWLMRLEDWWGGGGWEGRRTLQMLVRVAAAVKGLGWGGDGGGSGV